MIGGGNQTQTFYSVPFGDWKPAALQLSRTPGSKRNLTNSTAFSEELLSAATAAPYTTYSCKAGGLSISMALAILETTFARNTTVSEMFLMWSVKQ
jgi:hypothetical protein